MDLKNFFKWFEDHKNYALNHYINSRDNINIYNYELCKFKDVFNEYVNNWCFNSLISDHNFYNNVNINYAYIILLDKIINILNSVYPIDLINGSYTIYINDLRYILKNLKKSNSKYKICKI